MAPGSGALGEGVLGEAVRAAAALLAVAGVRNPRLEAELLAGRALGLGREVLLRRPDLPVEPAAWAGLVELAEARARGLPCAYLLGEKEFCSLALEVGPSVLIPRPETELLVDLAAELAPHSAVVLDLGTGSGAIAVALACRRRDVRVVATDVSSPALEVARRNAARHGCLDRIALRQGSWWEAVQGERFALAAANPPYVDPLSGRGLEAEVALHEPARALFTAPGDPLSEARAVVAGAAAGLEEGGWLLVEVGAGQAGALQALVEELPGLSFARCVPDLAGIPRCLVARKSP